MATDRAAKKVRRARPAGARAFFCACLLLLPGVGAAENMPRLALPTVNDALYRGGGPEFYQYIERNYRGARSTPWEGGRYGFVRNPVPTGRGLVYSRFHEGIDIRCVGRDDRGEPLDEVRAIAEGRVVHVNPHAGQSNYGRYVVLEHQWGGSSYYSLYAHLNSIAARAGARVAQGEAIGRLGYTGAGINRERAHLHLELNLMLNRNFESWHRRCFPGQPNYNGIYNGLNLAGLDIAGLYLAQKEDPTLTLPQFLAREQTFYKIAFPDSKNFFIRREYPWLVRGDAGSARAWAVSFARTGVPIRIEPLNETVDRPTLTFVKRDTGDLSLLTGGRLAGRGENARLTDNGRRTFELLIHPD